MVLILEFVAAGLGLFLDFDESTPQSLDPLESGGCWFCARLLIAEPKTSLRSTTKKEHPNTEELPVPI